MTNKISINGKTVTFKKGETILEVATNAGIYIPTLCARPDLPSIGACRLCIVKIDGVRGYRNSCTMPAEAEMVITTATPEIQSIRKNILEMILSEHPSLCIVCKDKDECETLRQGEFKAGRVIGCYTCSYKNQCELRVLAEYLRIKDIRYPMLYKNLPLERDDPFIERDYNLCILCGRCVRACSDVLGHGAISFTKRGHDTKIDTMLGISHIEAGCHFCGHCIDVCPTGALTARGSKWYGKPENSVATTCILCSQGCQMIVDTRWKKVVSVHPEYKFAARREYCVKGRFCIPALFNGNDRMKYPTIKKEMKNYPVSWEDAINFTAEKLNSYSNEDRGVFISPYLTDEAIYVLVKFAKEAAGSKFAFDMEGLRNFTHIKALYLTQQLQDIIKFNFEFLILQDIYRSPFKEIANVVFPACAFTEEEGTKTCQDYVKNNIYKAADPPGISMPDWEITVKLAQAMGLKGFDYKDIKELQDEMMTFDISSINAPMIPKNSIEYRGIQIAEKVEEFRIFLACRYKIKEQGGKNVAF